MPLSMYELTLIASGLSLFAGLIVYLVFYVMFKRLYGDKVKCTSSLKEDVVMCGMEYYEEELTIPVSRVFTDIMKRALPWLHKRVIETGGSRVLNDWFFWMIVLLTILLTITLVWGW